MRINQITESRDMCNVCGQTPCNCTHLTEHYDAEYDDEAGMAETNLHTIARAAQGLLDTIDNHENLPEWVQEKIAKVEGMIVAAWDYLKSQEEQGIDPVQDLTEFAPASNPGGGNYLLALASAWYNGTFKTGNLHKGIKSQEDVERILERGIHCGDGKIRKYSIGYNAEFDGVDIQSDDHYEYADHDDAGRDIDSRTGQPWGPYDVVAFGDDDLDESLNGQQGVAEGKIQYGVLDNDNVNLIIDKSESKPDGIYSFRGILFKVKGGKVTHYATDGKILQAMGRFNTQLGSYDSSSQAKSILKGIKEGVAEGHDSEDLANEVYAEFERIYPNLARRADERTIHAAIMDVLNYGGDSNPSALAQDVARAVKRDMQQGMAEGQRK